MTETLLVKNGILASVATAATVLIEALGGWDGSLKLLLGMMAADYITGLLVAGVWKKSNKSESGALSSKAGFKGLCRKGAILLVVWVGTLLDEALGVSYVRTALCLFFVGNEGLSLLENLGLMGLNYPDFLRKALESLHDQNNNAG